MIRKLGLEQAIKDEAASTRNLLPPQPGWKELEAGSKRFARWLKSQLLAGLPTTSEVIVAAGKAHQGIRPVPIWGMAERVTYRALTTFVLKSQPALDRSPTAYLAFVTAPLKYGRDLGTHAFSIFRSDNVRYVVKADIAAFYEYVDHEVLGAELLTQTGEYDAINCLLSLLEEVQGRRNGIPQLLDPSDWLSEIYIDRVHRAMIRRGWPTWRFNDDFRIAAGDYGAALAAIEDLASTARDSGLVLSDFKTTTPKFSKYAWGTVGADVDDEFPGELKLTEPEDVVADYSEGVGTADHSWALELVTHITTPDSSDAGRDGWTDLSKLSGDDIRKIRRALAYLANESSQQVIDKLVPILSFVRSLTPWVLRLCVAGFDPESAEWQSAIRTITTELTLSDWQRSWVIWAIDDLGLLDEGYIESEALIEWVAESARGRPSAAVQAWATVALARTGRVGYAETERQLAVEPGALRSWYLIAVRRLRDRGDVTDEQVRAAKESGVATALLHGT